MNINFIEAGIADLENLCSLVYKFYEVSPEDSLADKLKINVTKLLQNPAYGKAWLIVDGTKPVGYIVLTFGFSIEYNGRDALIDEFFIKDSYRNKGIGKAALDLAAAFSKDSGIKAVHLEVKDKHGKAETLYEREGFVKHRSFFMTKLL